MNNYPAYGHYNPTGAYYSPMQSGAHVPQHPYAFMPYQPYSGHMMNMHMPTMQMPLSPYGASDCMSEAEVNLLLTFRNLWEEHVSWTRMVIMALVFNLPNTNETVTRLLRNADDMGKALGTIYGPKVGSMFRDLIRDHLTIAADLVKAAIAGDQVKFAALDKKWTENGIAIATFLSKINPYIEFEEFRNMFLTHLEQTKNEASFMIKKEYKKDIAMYDEVEKHARVMADYMTEAIVKQFPHMYM